MSKKRKQKQNDHESEVISNSKTNEQMEINDTDTELEENKEDDLLNSCSDEDGFDVRVKSAKQLLSRINTNEPTPEEKHELANMFIKLKREVLPQHKVEKTAGTRFLREREKQEFEQYTSLRTGPFSKQEDKIIKKNWKTFCKMHDWNKKNPYPFLQMRHKNKESYLSAPNRLKFVQFLADGLSDRSLYSVYNRFKILYDKHKICRYESEEDEIILSYIRNYKRDEAPRDRQFADLAKILKRTRASVWRRYKLLKKKQAELSKRKS